jgi:hypothetical protein
MLIIFLISLPITLKLKRMKRFLSITITAICIAFSLISNTNAQDAKKEFSVVVPDVKQIFTEVGNDMMQIEFMLKDMYSGTDTKQFTGKATSHPEIKEFLIKNIVDQNGCRQCYAVVKKSDYKMAFSKILIILEVKTIIVGESKTDIPGFFEILKK